MTIIDRPLRMPRPVFLALWHAEALGEVPVVVEQTPMYLSADGAAERAKRTRDLLTELGAPAAAALRATLELLASARREVYAWTDFGTHQDDNGAILVAASGRDAVRLITDGEAVQLDPVSPQELADCLVLAMPACPAAQVRPLHVPKDYYDGESVDPLAEEGGAADELRFLMRAPRDAVHELHAAIRDNHGDRTHSTPLSAIDLTGRGRILSFLNINPDGSERISVYPGTRAYLIDALNLTLDALN
ncbi:ESX secretion-associated protein EspG [Amycolatopsis sp. NBC_01480]|uniref:ESX secretion-associated protein EspG n=1 Tax=Amycolatopsis sp. NBC_01480 TaxID=2903562 RepID=UPI002E2B8FCF|nr:ESX secretion-associated protein EspG [Amycolatopsis sp. NBC_01480]